jgi:hypothetical protein
VPFVLVGAALLHHNARHPLVAGASGERPSRELERRSAAAPAPRFAGARYAPRFAARRAVAAAAADSSPTATLRGELAAAQAEAVQLQARERG